MRKWLVGATAVILMQQAGTALAQEQPERFSLSMFHFNVQYVAGGLRGWPTGEYFDQPSLDLDEEETEDQIIRESFEPVLNLFLDHPNWAFTVEMQAYMVEVMMARHPYVLEKLAQLVDAGQAELVSFHYSDQLFLAYPRLDMERSHELMDEVWADSGLVPSRVVFCQEGQFGVGIGPLAMSRDWDILGLPKNLFRYQHEIAYETAPLLYDLDGATVVLVGRGVTTPDVVVSWNFFDDGELLATGGLDPYLGTEFDYDPAAVAEYEQELMDREAEGYRIATITEFVEWADEHGISREPLPPLLDGTWQPRSTDSMFRWMGAGGAIDKLMVECERDNQVLTGNVRARHRIQAAETLVAYAVSAGVVLAGGYDDQLRECWREVLLAQVTDATGINPFYNEIHYGLDHGVAAFDCAQAIILEIGSLLGDPRTLEIDTATGVVNVLAEMPSDDAQPAATPFLTEDDGFGVAAPGREIEVAWEEVGDTGTLHRVRINVSPPEDEQRSLEVSFPWNIDSFVLTPGLIEDRIDHHSFEDFEFEEARISLPLGNGLLGLAEGLWLIKETTEVHVAATFEPPTPQVLFVDETLASDVGTSWTFWILEGDEEEALALANRLNISPTITVGFQDETDDGGPDADVPDAGPDDTGPDASPESVFNVSGGACGCRAAGTQMAEIRPMLISRLF